MRRLFMAVLLASGVSGFGAADAADGCGPGCHNALNGGCVVDGWEAGARVFNECPAGARPSRPCPARYAWKFKACFPN
jgi:hypothetical protein